MPMYRKGLWHARVRCTGVRYPPQVFVPFKEMVDEDRPDLGLKTVPGRYLLHQVSDLYGWVQWCIQQPMSVWVGRAWQEQA